jgi:hypothetical protein
MSEKVLLGILAFGQALWIPAIAGLVRLNKTLTTLKFYTRKLCIDQNIDCGKDLD